MVLSLKKTKCKDDQYEVSPGSILKVCKDIPTCPYKDEKEIEQKKCTNSEFL